MVTGYIFTAFLIILGLAVMRFGSIHFKKFKEGKTKIKSRKVNLKTNSKEIKTIEPKARVY